MRKKILVLSLVLFSIGSVFATYGQVCDTQPDPGQIVGKCISGSNEEGQYAACGINYEGPICYFGKPAGEQ